MGTLSEQGDPPRKKRRQGKPAAAPSWETTRSFALEKRTKATLPVIQQDGEVKRVNVPRPKFTVKAVKKPAVTKAEGQELEDAAALGREGEGDVQDVLSAGKRKAKAPQRKNVRKKLEAYAKKIEGFEITKGRIAALASRVIASPEENVALLKELRKLAHQYKGRAAALVMLTESQLYKDIIPAYKIREITEKEAETKVSKDVARLRTYEENLLSNYQRYVKSCVSLTRWRTGGGIETQASSDMRKVRLAACKALAELIRSLPHFNEAETVASCVCYLVADREEIVRKECCDALKTVLGEAHRASGQTLSICVAIAKHLSNVSVGKIHAAPAEAVEPLVEIQFARFARLPPSSKAKNAPKKSKRFIKKRRRKPEKHADDVDETQLEKDLREGDAEATPQELYAAKKRMLDSVCHAYFNIVKAAAGSVDTDGGGRERGLSRKRKPPVALPAALKGLLRVATFINTDIIEAIVAALTPLLEGARLPLNMRFRCLSASYAVLSVHSRTQQTDPDSFTGDARAMDKSLYTALGCLFGDEMPAKDDETISFDAVEAVLSCNSYREIPKARCAAIARRLCVKAAACATTHACSIGLLLVAQQILSPTLVSPIFLQGEKAGESELGTDLGLIQVYDMDTEDPEIANAERSVAWEMASLVSHFHPAVQQIARKCASGYCGARLPKVNENVLVEGKRFASGEGGFNPPPASSPPSQTGKRLGKRRRNPGADSVVMFSLHNEDKCRTFIEADDKPPQGYLESCFRVSTGETD